MTNLFEIHACDLCGSDDGREIPVTRRYFNDHPLHVCGDCGFVYVRERRSAERITNDWSNIIYGSGYVPRLPAIVARHVYVAEFVAERIGLNDRSMCDIGAGTGQFLEIALRPEYSAIPFGIEPSTKNCQRMAEQGINNFCGTIESYISKTKLTNHGYSIATLLWTVENSKSCRTLLDAAHDIIDDSGHVVVATGSRILVPFKKPLHDYLGLYEGTETPDTHSFWFSANSLQNLLEISGFEVVHVNRYIDTDYLVMIGKKVHTSADTVRHHDNPNDVINYFERWDRDTHDHFPKA
jgi:hypothetical protein